MLERGLFPASRDRPASRDPCPSCQRPRLDAGPASGDRRLGHDRRGATAIEYALLASLSTILAFAAFMSFGGSLASMYTTLTTALGGAMGG